MKRSLALVAALMLAPLGACHPGFFNEINYSAGQSAFGPTVAPAPA